MLGALFALLGALGCGTPEDPFRFTGEGGIATPIQIVSDVPLVQVAMDGETSRR